MIHSPLALCTLAFAAAPQEAQAPLFPPAKEALVISAGPDGGKLTYHDLVRRYADVTGQDVTMSEDTESILRSRDLGLTKAVEIPPTKVQHTFETLLLSGDFVLNPPISSDVPIFRVSTLNGQGRSTLRSRTTFIDPDQMELAAAHPAVMFTVSVNLPNCDVRQLSNSMRTMIVDANTQQMLPAGNSHSMVLVGFGGQIAGMVRTLRLIDDAAGREQAAIERKIQVVQLQNAEAEKLSSICAAVFNAKTMPSGKQAQQQGAPRVDRSLMIVPDARTNSLVVRGTVSELERVTTLIRELDIAPLGK